ncbi:MAG: aspartate kinase [Clostridiales bacterium]|nr:aspartate kinase [Clostridiales bacterium]
MGIKVAKFGGSSVADAIQLGKIKSIVEADPSRRYVVVSAPGKRYSADHKITDLLYLCRTQLEHNVGHEQVFQVIGDRFRAMAMTLGVEVGIEKELSIINENLLNGCSADYIASRGEYLQAKITAAYLGFDFIDAAGLVKFDAKGRFLDEATNEALAEELAKHEKVVMPGFYGAMPDGSIKTFSRGGSDITGALVARAVKADVYENWTDVSGFLMADPRIVDDPAPIENISYTELRELSYMGASVLHEDAIYPAKVMNIPINIRNTNDPSHPGTNIMAEVPKSDKIITGIAGSKDFVAISIYKSSMSTQIGFVRRALSVLEDYRISVEHLPSGIDTLCLVIAKKSFNGKMDEVVEELERRLNPDQIIVHEDIALVATVGWGMASRPGVSATLFNALYKADVNVHMIDQGSSEMNIIVGVSNDDMEKTIRAIYEAFSSHNLNA